jgi:N-acetylneuraminic acid mutarotase
VLIGGDDGHMAGVVLRPGEKHPGFSRRVWRYSVDRNIWVAEGELPVGLVTTGAAVLRDGPIVIPGGEDRPGSRSNQVLELNFDK